MPKMSDEQNTAGISARPWLVSYAGKVQIVAQVSDQEVELQLFLCGPDGVPQPRPMGGFILDSPSTFSNDPDLINAWLQRFQNSFRGGFERFVAEALLLLLQEAVWRSLSERDITPAETKEHLGEHLDLADRLAKQRLDVKPTGRSAQWTAKELTRAITDAFKELRTESRTYDNTAKKLRARFGQRAPASGGALRQQILRLKLNWKVLKRETEFRRKATSVSYVLDDSET
jgi:hypothetical protein